MEELPGDWRQVLADTLASPSYQRLAAFVDGERRQGPVYPPEGQVFTALRLTPYAAVRVVLLGQDPYHGPGQAQGLAFSVPDGVRPPPSLLNIFRELSADVGVPVPRSGSLVPWARQGVLLLNTVLTVREGRAASHAGKGWEAFTDAVLDAVSAREQPVVFVLWGRHARNKAARVDRARHVLLEGVHPSPLSARSGFFGSRPFSHINAALARLGQPPIDWRLPG